MMVKLVARTSCALCLVGAFAGTVAAQQPSQQPASPRSAVTAPGIGDPAYRQESHLTFSGTVQLPGVTLPAGEYIFKLADPADGRSVVQVTDAAGKAIGLFQSRVVSQTQIAKQTEVKFLETPANAAPAIGTVWFGGSSNGREFMYTKEQTDQLARVATTPGKSTTNIVSNDPAARPAASADNNVARADAPAATPAPAAAQSANQTPPRTPAQPVGTAGATRTELPRTATQIPLAAFVGVIALMSGLVIRRYRTARG